MIIIDRFEGELAVIEEDGVILNIPITALPENAKEGSVLIKTEENKYELDLTASKSRKATIKNRFASLIKKK